MLTQKDGNLILFTILSVTGLICLVLGWLASVPVMITVGVGFLVITDFALRQSVAWQIMLCSFVAMCIGAVGGYEWVLMVNPAVAFPAGIIGGAALGAVAGLILPGLVTHSGSDILIHFFLASRYPRIALLAYFVPMAIGAAVGAIYLQQFVVHVFGIVGSTTIGGGLFGHILGTIIGIGLRQLMSNMRA